MTWFVRIVLSVVSLGLVIGYALSVAGTVNLGVDM